MFSSALEDNTYFQTDALEFQEGKSEPDLMLLELDEI
jgi:hypothetical protein